MSVSNIATTMLCYSALTIDEGSDRNKQAVAKARSWLVDFAGGLEPDQLAKAVDVQYGKDRSFSAPILTMCALAGRLGDSQKAWRHVKPLPFELAVFPHKFFKWLQLPVVSYALPALIAIGQANYYHRKPANPVSRLIRSLSHRKTLNVLGNLQPTNGGFLEAVPLTSFVVMSLAASGQERNEVVQKGTRFLVNSARDDGSWPIDTDLATWLTTLSINALNENPDFNNLLPLQEQKNIRDWLLGSQYRHVHPYTNAEPGGWAWTDLPGAVPDADDTAGALIGLWNLGPSDDEVKEAAIAGIKWLLDLQNRDGGIPTFCRGWTALPFDRSAPDITAHALGAMGIWFDKLPADFKRQVDKSISRALSYLQNAQKQDGSWIPLWFGNQYEPHQENPLYGTARALSGLSRLPERFRSEYSPMTESAATWLLSNQNTDGGWGGAKSIGSTIEETALAVDALAANASSTETLSSALIRGTSWLIENTEAGTSLNPSPIGLYFARLWYYEELYPLIFATAALQKVKNLVLIQ
ncbi:MAG: prenyltransferase/squalene oxidase repeat-containing protein [Planctomycetota bacterium]|jgi:squalene-hopene/tetraprenyl-beta-curcumene cyclase